MAKYKVIALSVGGLGNKIFKSKDIVTDKNFKPGRAEELVKLKFLEEIPEEVAQASDVNSSMKANFEMQMISDMKASGELMRELMKYREDANFALNSINQSENLDVIPEHVSLVKKSKEEALKISDKISDILKDYKSEEVNAANYQASEMVLEIKAIADEAESILSSKTALLNSNNADDGLKSKNTTARKK